MAAAFTAMDWARGHRPGLAFPWLGPGVDMAGTPLLIQAADTIGARGLTFLAVVVSTLVAEALAGLPRRWWRLVAAASVPALQLAYGVWRLNTLPVGATLRVGVVTAEVRAGDMPDEENLIASTMALRDSGVAFVVWPEAVDSTPLAPGAALRHALERLAESGTPVLAGFMARDSASGALSNTVRWFSASGGEDVVYRKRRLVPGVESETTRAGDHGPLVATPAGAAGILICFESGFEDLARDYRRRGAGLLINPTNDAWGAGTTGPAQHRAHLILRAVETRAVALRVTNLGVSEAIDPLGRVTRIAAGPVALPGQSPDIPPYVRLGDWAGLLSLVLSGGMLAACYRAGTSRTASRNMANRSVSRRPERTSSPMMSKARSTGTADL
jgi:apolipoprotein N-acyltransferase